MAGFEDEQTEATLSLPATGGAFVVVAEGQRLTLDETRPQRVLVGSSPACELRLAGRQISRRHCALELAHGALKVTDLGSTNGTFVQGVRIESALLVGGETIRVGHTTLTVETRSAPVAALPLSTHFGLTVGASPEMRKLYPLCQRLAASDVPVVIEGETGTGKEALAESLHLQSARAKGPFVVFDCTATPATLFESELLGHERGAFTGATSTRKGTFEQAHQGTLFIDEIGDLDLSLQAKLLRVVETGTLRRVGGSTPIAVDARIVCATRRDLDRAVQEGRFRDDLFFRLAVTRIELPPLRNRSGDIATLAAHFWAQLNGPGGRPPQALLDHWVRESWPGNVRELRNAVARAIALGDLGTQGPSVALSPTSIDDFARDAVARGQPMAEGRERLMREFEQRYLERLVAVHGDDTRAIADAAGIGRRYVNLIRSRSKAQGTRGGE